MRPAQLAGLAVSRLFDDRRNQSRSGGRAHHDLVDDRPLRQPQRARGQRALHDLVLRGRRHARRVRHVLPAGKSVRPRAPTWRSCICCRTAPRRSSRRRRWQPFSRKTIPVDEQPGLAETDVSARITVTNGVGIIAERAMYRTSHGTPFNAGHDSAGVTAANTNWFFAEGATGELLRHVPAARQSVDVADRRSTVRYLLPGGAPPFVKSYPLRGAEPHDDQCGSRRTRRSQNAAIAMVVDADAPIVAERAMYCPGPSGSGWLEAHNSPGTTETGTVWAIAGGEMGGANATQTFVLIANTSNFAGQRARHGAARGRHAAGQGGRPACRQPQQRQHRRLSGVRARWPTAASAC